MCPIHLLKLKIMKKLFILLLTTGICFPCVSQTTTQEEIEEDEKVCNDFDPSVWEDPSRAPLRDKIGDILGDLNGKTVVDIGAGAGYFSFEYAKTAEKVIATELDERLIKYISAKIEANSTGNVIVKKGTSNYEEFQGEQIDFAIMVDVYHEIVDPKKFLPVLKLNMNSLAKIVVVESHISPVIVTDYLENAGFLNIEVEKFNYINSCGSVEVSIISATNILEGSE